LLVTLATIGSKSLLNIFTLYNDNKAISELTIQLLVQLSSNRDSFQRIYSDFQPYILECFQILETLLASSAELNTLKPQDITLMEVPLGFSTIRRASSKSLAFSSRTAPTTR